MSLLLNRRHAACYCATIFALLAPQLALAQAANTAPVATESLPTEVPAAPGNQALQNPAPAPASAPTNSVSVTPPTTAVISVVSAPVTAGAAPVLETPRRVQTGCSLRDYGAPVERGQLAAAIYNTCSGFSLHKPGFLLPATYSDLYHGRESEFIFQFSGKVQLWDFGPGALYFSYSQKSFFQVFNSQKSKPFRENDYNPELFSRVPHPFSLLPNWSFDIGAEHESNGEDLPKSRSYNRLFLAPYWSQGRQAVQLKAWWRLPEDKSRAANDPNRDDNPDLGSYYGYTELHYRRDFLYRNQLIDLMLRGNALTGRGAIQADYSVEIGPVGSLFVRVFNGYGESLIDYNRSVFRVGVGLALQR